MTQDIKTLELAKIYERQGYDKDAFEIYSSLNTRETSKEIKAGLSRVKKKMENKLQGVPPEKSFVRLFETWVGMLVLKQRLDRVKKIKSQFLSS